MHAETGLLGVQFSVKVSLKMPLNKSRVQEGWVVFEHCSLFVLLPVSESARCAGSWVSLCLSCFSSVSEHGHTLPFHSAPISVWGSLSLPHAMHGSSLFFFSALRDAPLIVPSSLPSDSSCKHASASSQCEHMGVFSLPLLCGWGSCTVFWGGRASYILCICIPLSSSLPVSVCGAPMFRPWCLSGWGSSALPFPLVCSHVL